MENTNDIMEINGVKIEKNNCSCLKCYIDIKLIGLSITKRVLFDDSIYITQQKIYNLVEKYGITKIDNNSLIINTPELRYIVLLNK